MISQDRPRPKYLDEPDVTVCKYQYPPEKMRAYQRERRDKRRALGICYSCSNPVTGANKCYCKDHVEQMENYNFALMFPERLRRAKARVDRLIAEGTRRGLL